MSTAEAEAPATIVLDFAQASQPHGEAAQIVLHHAEERKGARDAVGGIKGLQIGKSDVYDVSPFDIKIKPGWNSRDFSLPENQRHVLELAESIAVRGVEEPLAGYYEGDTLFLSNGECRLRATLHVINVMGRAVKSVPIRMEPRGRNDADRIAGQLTRNQGKPLSRMEQAQVVKRLLAHKWSVADIAANVGMSGSNVRGLVDLLELSADVQAQVTAGVISPTTAVQLVKEHGDAAGAIVEAAAARPSGNGGRRAGKITPRALRAVASARDDIPAKLTLPALLSILKKAAEDAIEHQNGLVEIYISTADWDRISAAF